MPDVVIVEALRSPIGRRGGGLTASAARPSRPPVVGVDPVLMLTGPVDATHRLLARSARSMADIDTVEINEAGTGTILERA